MNDLTCHSCSCSCSVQEYSREDLAAVTAENQPDLTQPPPAHRRAFLKVALGSVGLMAVEGLVAPNAAEAIGEPSIASVNDWGARAPRPAFPIINGRPTYLVIHHTAGPNSTNYTRAHAYALARSIQAYHMDNNRWQDSGQHFTVSRGGYLMQGCHGSLGAVRGRTRHVVASHVAGRNSTTIGIENEGTYTSVLPTDALLNNLVRLSAWICQQYSINPSNIKGHRDFNSTACPGNRLYAYLPTLRSRVRALLG